MGDILCPCGIQLEVRDKDWIEAKKMHAFLTVARGSCEQPALLEIGYCGGPVEDKPVLLIGKGYFISLIMALSNLLVITEHIMHQGRGYLQVKNFYAPHRGDLKGTILGGKNN